MRLTQGATSTLSLVSMVLSLTAILFCAYTLWLEPERIRAQTELAKSNLEVARATIQLQEWLDAQSKRFDSEGLKVIP